VANLRLVLDVVVSPGKKHSAGKARPGLMNILDKLPQQQRPALVRGDCGFGNDPFIIELESCSQPYLFKLKQSVDAETVIQQTAQAHTTNARNRVLAAKKQRFLTAVHTLLAEQDEEWMIAKIYLTMKP
jgi:hypothetical protein